ncbi:MAG: peptidylprolyl isomerase [Clostridia bacterium]|nr:peptidylprolyl isomerase [Clostridia bacterium]NCC45074.1 peptidylprolyl isomerase [Clostridia bacterium]
MTLVGGCGNKAEDTQSNAQNSSTDDSKVTKSTESSEEDIAQNGGVDDSNVTESVESNGDLLSGKHHIEINIKDYGVIKAELDADTAPITVTNFVNLAKDGFYDGLTFHRIMSGFMIQGGDPLGNGSGGADEKIKGEFAQNGVENPISHARGVISMARSQDMDSASSQFFIMHADYPSLDGAYAAFGNVTEGIEIVDAICEDTPVQDDNGTVLPEDQPVIESVKVVD